MPANERKMLFGSVLEGEEPKGGFLLAKCERVIGSLGEDGVKPLNGAELKTIKERLGYGNPEMRDYVIRPVLLGSAALNWIDVDTVDMSLVKTMMPRNETILHSYLDSLINMGAKSIERTLLVQAGWDHALIEKIRDDGLADRFLAMRLNAFDGYLSRKMYALSLGLMEFKGND